MTRYNLKSHNCKTTPIICGICQHAGCNRRFNTVLGLDAGMKKFDVAIIGGGVLGTAVSYWLSVLYDMRICVIEKERGVAMHASSRNTGVVHSPFYLNPRTKGTMASAAYLSYDMWKSFAKRSGIPWRNTGTMEVSMNESQHETLEKYTRWGLENGLSDEEITLLDSRGVAEVESQIRCYSGLFCRRDASTEYGMLTRALGAESERNGVSFMTCHTVRSLEPGSGTTIHFLEGGRMEADLVINCAGGDSLDVAQLFGLAVGYSDLHFRGEYWIADERYSGIVGTNVYPVAEFPEFPFLDPHWIRRANGSAEIGPNAVPVASSDAYEGYISDIPTAISKITEIITSGTRRLLTNPDFISLVTKEFLSSISKTAMVERVRRFIPAVDRDFFTIRGTAGIRTPVISPEGRFVPDVMEMEGESSFHVINYNSPGATGAPAYSARIVQKLRERGFLDRMMRPTHSIWKFDEAVNQD